MAKPVQQQARKAVPLMTYEFKCAAEHHPDRSGEPGWYDGVLSYQTAPAPPAPAPEVVVYCTACATAIDAGEAP